MTKSQADLLAFIVFVSLSRHKSLAVSNFEEVMIMLNSGKWNRKMGPRDIAGAVI